ncbi:MAG TPA: MFS transporter, partial [Rectinemataceae bacterium]|nr:MFS transporter [Rectinemataceae bacterium]
VTTIGMYAGLFYIPLFLQSIRGIGAMETGLLMMPGALVTAVMMPITGKLFDKVGARALVIAGLFMLAFLTLNFANLNLATATSTITMWIVFRGMVMAFAMMPAQTASLIDIPTDLISRASSISNIIRSVAGSFGLAILTSILTARQAFHGARLSWTLTLSNPVVADTVSKIAGLAGGGTKGRGLAAAYLFGQVSKTSFVNAIDDVFIVAGMFTFVALVPALFLKSKKAQTAAAGAHRTTAMAAE